MKNTIDKGIICGNARFTALTNGLIRMEYSKNGFFEDRGTIRIPVRPQAISFDKITNNGKKTVLEIGKIVVEFIDDCCSFSAANLKIF